MASKDPAFLFYSKDWIEGTAELSPAEKGVYIDLLCYQHQKSDLPSDLHRICRLVRLSYDEFLVIWNVISDKFYVDGERMFNIKLSEVMSERSLKGKKNKIIGIFASLLRKSDLSKKEYSEVRSSFKADDFMQIDSERLTERLTEWYELRLKSIANEDVNANEDIYDNNSISKKKIKKGIAIYFKDSVYFDKNKFKEALSDWSKDKLAYYYESALTWSNEDNKKIDWIAAVKTWANRDEKKGNIKFEKKDTKRTEAPDYQAFIKG